MHNIPFRSHPEPLIQQKVPHECEKPQQYMKRYSLLYFNCIAGNLFTSSLQSLFENLLLFLSSHGVAILKLYISLCMHLAQCDNSDDFFFFFVYCFLFSVMCEKKKNFKVFFLQRQKCFKKFLWKRPHHVINFYATASTGKAKIFFTCMKMPEASDYRNNT